MKLHTQLGILAVAMAASLQAMAEPAIVYDMGGKFDKSFNEAAYNGMERWKKETGKNYLEFEVSNESQREQARWIESPALADERRAPHEHEGQLCRSARVMPTMRIERGAHTSELVRPAHLFVPFGVWLALVERERDLGRQTFELHGLPLTDRDCIFDRVLELSNVAWPRVSLERDEHIGREPKRTTDRKSVV